MNEQILHIEYKRLYPSPLNPRSEYPIDEIMKMADTIKEHGILQNLIVRAGQEMNTFEIVAGHRRYRAAGEVGLKTLPCVVKELTDEQVVLLMAVENGQREDLDKIEQADAFQKLLDTGKITVEKIAESIGKGLSTVRNMLKLRRLSDKARKALRERNLLPSIAALIATRPSQEIRDKLTEFSLKPRERFTGKSRIDDLPTFAEVKNFCEDQCMVELKGSPFPVKSLEVLPTAGSCEKCPKRTGNNREEYPDGRADICTDPECYKFKCEAWAKIQMDKALAAGHIIGSNVDARRWFAWGGTLSGNSGMLDLDDICYQDTHKGGRRTYRKLIGKSFLPADITAVIDLDGKYKELVPKKLAEKLLEKIAGIEAPSFNGSMNADQKTYAEKEKARKAKKAKANREAITSLMLRVRVSLSDEKSDDGWTEALNLTANAVFDRLWDDGKRNLLKDEGIEAKTFGEKKELFKERLGNLQPQELAETIILILAYQEASTNEAAGKELDSWFAATVNINKREKNGKKQARKVPEKV